MSHWSPRKTRLIHVPDFQASVVHSHDTSYIHEAFRSISALPFQICTSPKESLLRTTPGWASAFYISLFIRGIGSLHIETLRNQQSGSHTFLQSYTSDLLFGKWCGYMIFDLGTLYGAVQCCSRRHPSLYQDYTTAKPRMDDYAALIQCVSTVELVCGTNHNIQYRCRSHGVLY